MAYVLGNLPTDRATMAEKADFMEFQCLLSAENRYSVVSGESAMGISFGQEEMSNDDSYGFEDALMEIEDRYQYSGEHYPFVTSVDSLYLRENIDEKILEIYKFLLLATRENMFSGRVADSIDGTALFEKLCALVLQNYFGRNSSSIVFGTGQDRGVPFREKVSNMLDILKEGNIRFREPDKSNNYQKDAKLDVVVVIPFADNRKGRFIAFGQCKTGTTWRQSVSQLNPDAFCKTYLEPTPGFTPIGVFMVAESFSDNWEVLQRSTNGILFDRNRIMNYLPEEINSNLFTKIQKWNRSVMSRWANNT